jgi:hypothetical protein
MTVRVTYNSNNSGGSWWLTDDDWHALEDAGWEVDWYANQDRDWFAADEDGRWLGALASSASVEADSIDAAVADWERITRKSPRSRGCSCCGVPHNFHDDQYNHWSGHAPSNYYAD